MTKSANRSVSVSRRKFLKGAGAGAGSLALVNAFNLPAQAQETFVWYSGWPTALTDDVSKMFTEKTGIPVEYFRAGSNQVAQKFEQEVKANQLRCSAVEITNPPLAADWAKQGLVLPYKSPEFAHYPADAVLEDSIGTSSVNPHVICYNTELVDPSEAPKTWQDILDPKWKGKMVMTDGSSSSSALHWFTVMKYTFGDEFVEKLATQDVLMVTGGAAVGDILISGERAISIMMTQAHASNAIAKGGALRIVVPEEGTSVLGAVVFVPAAAPQPEVGKQFMDHILGEDVQSMVVNKYHNGSLRKGLKLPEMDTGAKPASEIKALLSSPADLVRFDGERAALSEQYLELFK